MQGTPFSGGEIETAVARFAKLNAEWDAETAKLNAEWDAEWDATERLAEADVDAELLAAQEAAVPNVATVGTRRIVRKFCAHKRARRDF